MPKNNMTFKIGGEAGQGVESGGAGFAQILARAGLHVFGLQDYMSRIRGGHNYYQIRVSEHELHSHSDEVHLLLALIPETVTRHASEIVPGGALLYDESIEVDESGLQAQGVGLFPVPLFRIAEEAGDRIMANTAAFAAAAGVTGLDFSHMAESIRDSFGRKGAQVVDANLQAAQRAYDLARERYGGGFGYRLEAVDAPRRMLISGNHAFCLGAVLGGCRFLAAYPMTPASSILEWMATHAARYGLVSKHSEDEIAALCMAIGANYAGVRAMVSTSGGGFALMVEALGLAGMTETPVVIVESQRPGPSTGMPTRTEQGDLLFTLHASQGEFPRILLAPGTVGECFEAGWRAFNLAEKYQCPVIVLLDNHISNSVRTVERRDLNFEGVKIDRGRLLTDDELDGLQEEYRRYALTETGISPRARPGHPKAVFLTSSDEHDELGHFDDEGAENRVRMVEKRMKKLQAAREEMRVPLLYGPSQADTTLVGWGSSYGSLREAVDRLNEGGERTNLLHFSDLWPLAEERVRPLLEAAGRLVAVESNATGQLAWLLRAATGVPVAGHIRRYDGRPLSPEYILERIGGHSHG